MTSETAIKIRDFAIQWIEEFHSRSRKATKEECQKLLHDLIPDNIAEHNDAYDVLSWEHWDWRGNDRSPSEFFIECRDWGFWGRVYTPRVIELCEEAFEDAMETIIENREEEK